MIHDAATKVDAGGTLRSTTGFSTYDQIEKLASSTIFINQLASVLVPKSEGNPPIQQAVEIDLGEVTALIKRTLSSNDGFTTKTPVAKTNSRARQFKFEVPSLMR